MDFKGMVSVVKQHLIAVIVLLVLYSGGLVFLWDGYKELDANKIKFLEEKAANIESQSKREIELQKREYNVQQAEEEVARIGAEMRTQKIEHEKSLAQLKTQQNALSEGQARKEAEVRLQSLMSEFSALGVDLNSNPYCGTKDDLKRYNNAKAKYDEIYSLAKAYSLDKKYSDFLFHNEQFVISFACASDEKRG